MAEAQIESGQVGRLIGRVLGHLAWATPLGVAAWLTTTAAWPASIVIILAYCKALSNSEVSK